MSEDPLKPLVTQCPNCDTRFRVTEEQLQVAQGRVRCGACLGVFDGTAHLSLDGEEISKPDEPVEADAGLEELGRSSEPVPASLPDLPDIEFFESQGMSSAARSDTEEESGEDKPQTACIDHEEGAVPDALLALEAELLDDIRTAQDDPADVLEEVLPAADVSPVVQAVADEPAGADLLPDQATTEGLPPAPDARSIEAQKDQGIEEALEAVSRVRLPDYATPDYGLAEERAPRRSWATMLLIVLAFIGLPAQILWFQYESWVKDPRFRPVYQIVCEVAGCQLPPLRDVVRIVSKKSIIRAHPDREDARIVDVLMVNNADFAQPYPLIELMATTIRGQLVAGRRFKPEEYLQGEVAAGELFPPRTPVHVSLEIQNPGEDALNFEVRFR